jgi:uncharacterized protein YndB with AHSA1/START domain
MTDSNLFSLTVTHQFHVSAEKVYDAFLDPSKACQFMFVTATGKMIKAEIDPRVGGQFLFVDRRSGEDVAHTGIYQELVRPTRIAFTFKVEKYSQDVDTITIDLQPNAEGCIVTLTHTGDAKWKKYSDQITKGWTEILQHAAYVVGDPTAKAPPPVVFVTRNIKASAEKIYAAWLDPQMIGQFMFGPRLREEEILHINVDPVVGGKFSFLVRREGKEIEMFGEYLALNPAKNMVFTWLVSGVDASSKVTIEFMELGNGTELMLSHEIHPDFIDYVSKTEEGWNRITGALADILTE